jgi:hypothetical protein
MLSDMKAKTSAARRKLQERINQLKARLKEMGPMRPGSLSRQYNVCGKPGCRCKDPKNPRRHGPYYKVSYVYRGRFSSRFVPSDQAKAVRAELANYKRFRELTAKWVGLSLRLAKEKRQSTA